MSTKRTTTKAKQVVVSNPGIHGGKPTISGTRITVETIQAVARDWSMLRILREYPGLTPAGVAAALVYKLPAKRPRAKLPLWRVWIEQVNHTYVDVRAEDQDGARERAERKWRREFVCARIAYVRPLDEPATLPSTKGKA